MYSLDINFLNDREERPSGIESAPAATGGPVNWTPAIVGVIVGAVPLALVLGGWIFLQNRNAALQRRVAELDTELQAVGAAQQQLAEERALAQQARDEALALATVFDKIRPWSALMRNFSLTVPSGVQIRSIEQAEGTEEESRDITVSGFANSFDDVNDFVLVLSRSPFLDEESTRLESATLVDFPDNFDFPEGSPSGIEVRVPQVVRYEIRATMTDAPASELISELENTLAVGLSSRIRALQDRGALQP
ncbi:MAG: PilN domain-containing protein [Leptolyngbyaceae bacterium]|nr:PilN domain-containing protein [Leptolyngbyaceae bacterium]